MRKAVKNKVTTSVPVRADIAGAFSDLAYYLDRDRDYVVPKLRIEEVTEYR